MSLPDISTLPPTSALIFSSSPSSPSPSSSSTARPTPAAAAPLTLPQIRAAHAALRAAAEDRRARLRDRVGASYRELLGTADEIGAMAGAMERALGALARAGRGCARAAVARKVEALEGLDQGGGGREDGEGPGVGTVGRARLLVALAVAAERLVRARGGTAGPGERLLVAGKVVVLGRLVGKRVGEVEGAVEMARRSLEASRRRLLRGVERVLGRVGGGDRREEDGDEDEREELLRALAAYGLVTGSGARDVLRYFLKMRGEAVRAAFEPGEDERARGAGDVLRAVRLYARTLLDVPALVHPAPRLAEALAALKTRPLVRDPALRGIEGLRLDVYGRWCGDEVEYFTPFVRHDDLDRAAARDLLADWAAKGADALLDGLERTLADVAELKAVVDLRTSVLRLWISAGGRVKGVDTSGLLDRIRGIVNRRMLAVVEGKVGKLRLVGSEVSATVGSWRELGGPDHHRQRLDFWDLGSLDLDLAHGAAHFTQEVIARLYGRTDAVSKAVASYKSWYKVVDDVGRVVEQLKRQRWDNDVDEIEDEETIEQRQRLLSKDDPQALLDHLNASLVTAFGALDAQLAALRRASEETDERAEVAVYLLRVVRDIRHGLPGALPAVRGFGLDLLPRLHERVASDVADRALALWRARHEPRVVGRVLWEGEPELPTSPSPDCFQFLRELSASMSDAGMDLWYPALATALKKAVNRYLREWWWKHVEELQDRSRAASGGVKEDRKITDAEEGEAEPNHETEEAKQVQDTSAASQLGPTLEEQRDVLVQWLFDISYLRCGLGLPSASDTSPDGLKELEQLVAERTELDRAARQRIAKASQEYWKRTSLLFGLLT